MDYAANQIGDLARESSESASPGLWDELQFAWSPEVAPQGKQLTDLSGHGRHTNSVTGLGYSNVLQVKAGRRALYFNNAANKIGIVNSAMFPEGTFRSTDFSMSFWIWANSVSDYNQFIGGWDENYGFAFHTTGGGGVYCGAGSGGAGFRFNNVANFPTGQWSNWVFTRDTAYSSTLYRNGKVVAGPTLLSSSGTYHLFYSGFFVGNTGAGLYLDGYVGTVLAYTRCLKSREVSSLYSDSLAPFRRNRRVSVLVPAGGGGDPEGSLIHGKLLNGLLTRGVLVG